MSHNKYNINIKPVASLPLIMEGVGSVTLREGDARGKKYSMR